MQFVGWFVFICEILSRLIFLYLQNTMHIFAQTDLCTWTLLSVCSRVEFSFAK